MTVSKTIRQSPMLNASQIKVRAAREVAAFLRNLRSTAHLSQKELAERLKVSQARISQIESGKLETLPAYDFICLYADACGATVSLTCENDMEAFLGSLAEEDVLEQVPSQKPGHSGRRTGTVKFFNHNRGFGFIKPEEGGKDVFVHVSQIKQITHPGGAVKYIFEMEADRRKKNMIFKTE